MKNDEPDEQDEYPEDEWSEIPRQVRDYIYAVLDSMEAAAVRDTEEARMKASLAFEARELRDELQRLERKGDAKILEEEKSRPMTDEEMIALVRENAWRTVTRAMRMLDPDYCSSCGQVHEPEKPHRDPKQN